MVVTTDAKELLASFLGGNSQTAPTHLAFGTDNTAPNEEDTTLTTENLRLTTTETTVTGREVKFVTIMNTAQGNGVTFREMGLLNASTTGTLFTHLSFIDLAKTSSFEIQAEITLRLE